MGFAWFCKLCVIFIGFRPFLIGSLLGLFGKGKRPSRITCLNRVDVFQDSENKLNVTSKNLRWRSPFPVPLLALVRRAERPWGTEESIHKGPSRVC